MRYELRPRSTTELIDGAFKLYRDHFGVFFGISLLLSPPLVLVTYLAEKLKPATDQAAANEPIALLGAVLAGLVVGIFVYFVQQSMLTCAVSDAYLGQPVSIGTSVRQGLRRVGWVMVAGVVSTLGITVGTLLCIIPGIILLLGWSFYVPAVVLEGRGGVDSLDRSWKLTRGRRSQIGLLLLLNGLISGALTIGTAVTLPASVVGIPVLGAFLTQLPSLLVTPLYSALITLAYFDARVRDEAFDLEMLARNLGGAPGPAPELPPA